MNNEKEVVKTCINWLYCFIAFIDSLYLQGFAMFLILHNLLKMVKNCPKYLKIGIFLLRIS